jgi:hypothetical protein
MKISYVSCFEQDEPAEAPLKRDLDKLASREGTAQDTGSLCAYFESPPFKQLMS